MPTTDFSPANAFAPGFLAACAERDQPAGVAEADSAGPWKVVETAEGRWAVLRRWESLEAGDRPRLVAASREDALFAAAALPGAGRADLYRLSPEPDSAGGYPVETAHGEPIRCAAFDAELVAGMHALRAAGLVPEALAAFLEAVGHAPLEHAGRILAARVAEPDDPPGEPQPPPS